MDFIWDGRKAATNLLKHRVSFEEARTIFSDPEAIRIFDYEHSNREDRYILLGMSTKLRILVVCHCYREEIIRIISARKATRKEIRTYLERKNES